MWTRFCQWLCARLHRALLVQSVDVLNMSKDDVLIVTYPDPLNREQLRILRQSWKEAQERTGIDMNRVMLLEGNVKLTVLRDAKQWLGKPTEIDRPLGFSDEHYEKYKRYHAEAVKRLSIELVDSNAQLPATE